MFFPDDLMVVKVRRRKMQTSHGPKDEDTPVKADVAVIGGGTPVRMNVILSILLPSALGLGYWANGVSTSLKTLVTGQAEMKVDIKGYESRIAALELQVRDFKLTGSPQVQLLEKRTAIIEHDLELHRISEEKKKP